MRWKFFIPGWKTIATVTGVKHGTIGMDTDADRLHSLHTLRDADA